MPHPFSDEPLVRGGQGRDDRELLDILDATFWASFLALAAVFALGLALDLSAGGAS